MLSITRGTGRPGADARGRRARGPLAISLAVNAAIVAVFFQAVAHGYNWRELFNHRPGEVPAERISFLRLPAGPTTQPGRSGGDGQPVSRGTPAARPRPAVPGVPPQVTAPVATTPGAGTRPGPGGSGAVVGEGGATEGIRPSYADPRLWGRPDVAVSAPRSAKERIDSVIADVIAPVRDSMLAAQALAAGQRQPGDWTVKGPGGKWGIDQRSIHLGKIAVPNALLALLSSKFQENLRGNPTLIAEARRQGDIRRDLLAHAQREMAEDDFRGAVKAIRARKDRERNARLAERRAAAEAAAVAADGQASASPPAQQR